MYVPPTHLHFPSSIAATGHLPLPHPHPPGLLPNKLHFHFISAPFGSQLLCVCAWLRCAAHIGNLLKAENNFAHFS